jgi:LuxR family maltose regulon positive regulatory protein
MKKGAGCRILSGVTASIVFRLRPPPAPASLIERPRITNRILSLEPEEMLIVEAAPGYGATTAVAQALRASGDQTLWTSLETGAADQLCRQLLAACLHSSPADGVDGFLTALDATGPAWLVVDGFDPVAAPGFARDLLDLATHLPRKIRMVITASHRFGPLPRALRMSEENLAFTDDEAFGLLTLLARDLDVDAADRIIEMSQGWASALVAAASHGGSSTTVAWLRSVGAASLLTDWFANLTPRSQHLLRDTRVLSTLSAGSCAQVAQQPRAAEILLELDAAHAYLSELPSQAPSTGRSWRRHTLLTAFLDQAFSDDRVAAHSRAADWYLSTDDVDAVMRHLIEAGRMKEAGSYLAARESALLSAGGQAHKVLTWYDQMGTAFDDRTTQLIRLGWGQAMSRDVVGADATLNRLRAEQADQRDLVDERASRGQSSPDRDPRQPGSPTSAWVAQTALLKGYLGMFHADPATVIAGGRRLAMEPSEHLNDDALQLAPILMAKGMLWSGQPEAAARVLEAAGKQPFPNDVLRETHLKLAIAQADLMNGDVRRAKVHADSVNRWLQRAGLQPEVLQFGPSLAVSAQIAAELGHLDEALSLAVQAVEDAQRSLVLAESAWAHLVVCRCQFLAGDYGAAMRSVREARATATRDVPDSSMVVVIDQMQASAYLAAGDLVRAVRLIRALPPSDARALLWARAGLLKQPAMARRTLEGIQSRMPRVEADRHALLAALHLRTSRRMAQGHLRKAAAIAAKHGLGQVLNPVDTGLLSLAESTALEYQDDNLFWLLKTRASQPAAHVESVVETPLSRGELQLLAVLPSRAKNVEIAESMGVSINTVKTRLRRLYAKLGANNRDEAIQRARARGLL